MKYFYAGVLLLLYFNMSNSRLILGKRSSFPLNKSERFSVSFDLNGKINGYDAISVQLMKVSPSVEVGFHLLEYGKSRNNKIFIKSEYVLDVNWYIRNSNLIIKITFKFKAMHLLLILREIEANDQKTLEIRKAHMCTELFINDIITFYITPNVSLKFYFNNNLTDVFYLNKIYEIRCEAKGGYPVVKPYVLFSKQLTGVVIPKKVNSSNKRVINYAPVRNDNTKTIFCGIKTIKIQKTIVVEYSPTKIIIQPPIHHSVERGKNFTCLSDGGNPEPKHSWIYSSGISTIMNQFSISNKNVLRIHKKATIGKSWTFLCVSENVVKSKSTKIKKRFTFSVKGNSDNYKNMVLYFMVGLVGFGLLSLVPFVVRNINALLLGRRRRSIRSLSANQSVERPLLKHSLLLNFGEINKLEYFTKRSTIKKSRLAMPSLKSRILRQPSKSRSIRKIQSQDDGSSVGSKTLSLKVSKLKKKFTLSPEINSRVQSSSKSQPYDSNDSETLEESYNRQSPLKMTKSYEGSPSIERHKKLTISPQLFGHDPIAISKIKSLPILDKKGKFAKTNIDDQLKKTPTPQEEFDIDKKYMARTGRKPNLSLIHHTSKQMLTERASQAVKKRKN